MAAPDLLSFSKTIATNDQITGPLIATFSIIAMFETTRNVLLLNLLIGAWLLMAPWILGYQSDTAFWSDYLVGMLALILSQVKLKRQEKLGGGWPALWKSSSG